MPSIVWGRDPQEAFDQPYEYGAQEQFLREFARFIASIHEHLKTSTLRYHRDERSLEKAKWMLAHDLVDTLWEISALIAEKRHRVASRLFRDCVEHIDLLKVLCSGSVFAQATLTKWYDNETLAHGKLRKYLQEIGRGATGRHTYYHQLSKFTHRTYRALSDSYSLGAGDFLVHDSYSKERLLVLPQVVAAYLAVLASLTVEASYALSECDILSSDIFTQAWQQALEGETIPRRFGVRPRGGDLR